MLVDNSVGKERLVSDKKRRRDRGDWEEEKERILRSMDKQGLF